MNRRRLSIRALAAAILVAASLSLVPQLALALDLSCTVASDATENAVLHAQDESDGIYLFLPGQADVDDLRLFSDQGTVEVWSYATRAYVDASEGADLVALGVASPDGAIPQSGATLWVRLDGTSEVRLTVMKSSSVLRCLSTPTMTSAMSTQARLTPSRTAARSRFFLRTSMASSMMER